MNKLSTLVSIRCFVYNQAPYVRQCLEGFVMQKTDFAFEAIVHDDASTDGTIEIVKEYTEKYPHIIKPIFEVENQYSKRDGSLEKIMDEQMCGKYIAICEGDDYWTDPLKLQKQVDFLESHPDYGLVYSKVNCYSQSKNKIIGDFGECRHSFEDLLLRGNAIPTLSVLFRKNLYEEYVKEIQPAKRQWKMGDYPIWLWLAQKNSVHFMNEVIGVYRVLKESASHSLDVKKLLAFSRSYLDIRVFFYNKYKETVNSQCINKIYSSYTFYLLSVYVFHLSPLLLKEIGSLCESKKMNFSWKEKIVLYCGTHSKYGALLMRLFYKMKGISY